MLWFVSHQGLPNLRIWAEFSFWLLSGYVSPFGTFALKEKKPPIVNNQCVVYKFECDLCDADYVWYTARHQRCNEHKYPAIGRHLEQHGLLKTDLVDKQFSVLKKRRSKFDCLIFEMLFIKELHPKLNNQKDSIRAKVITWLCVRICYHYHYIF